MNTAHRQFHCGGTCGIAHDIFYQNSNLKDLKIVHVNLAKIGSSFVSLDSSFPPRGFLHCRSQTGMMTSWIALS